MSTPEPLSDQELDDLEELAHAATPGPWLAASSTMTTP